MVKVSSPRWRHRSSVSTTALQRIRTERLQDESDKNKFKCRLKENISGLDELCMKELDLENIWQNVKKGLVDAATEVCGVSKRKNERKNNTLWWDDEIRMEVEAKKRAWLDLLPTKTANSSDTNGDIERKKAVFRHLNKRVKEVVERKKQERTDKNDRRISDNFQANIKMFWKLPSITFKISKRVVRGKCVTELKTAQARLTKPFLRSIHVAE
ncbi:unnamed protein product [Parnassius apollo]|uniref:(apollo) hypothetical protein n=1 Tax=Parnassius apollo TaxID=110799 RepID=A0A8S3XNJ5_PARAO|nr:unnamed protein product [Parnassius apollo]